MKFDYNTLINIIFLAIFLMVQGCAPFHSGNIHDPSLRLKRSDFQDLSSPPPNEIKTEVVAPISKNRGPSVTIHITPSSSLKEALKELAADVGTPIIFSFQGDPRITYQAESHPFMDALEEICSLANLRITLHPNHIQIQEDTPYVDLYSLPFLTLIRSNQNVTSLSTGILNTNESQGNLGNSSTTSLKGENKTSFWEDIESNLNDLVKKMTLDEMVPQPKLQGVVYQEISRNDSADRIKDSHRHETNPYYSLNKQAGFLIFYGTSQHHKIIQIFLDKLRNSLSAQILIEAKVIEVALKDEYKSGINWRNIFGKAISFNASLGDAVHGASFLGGLPAADDVMSLTIKGKDMAAILQLMETFGTVRTLSSPRLTVINNQSALLKVAENQVFFQIQYDRQHLFQRNEELSQLTASSKIQTIPVGFIMVVHPAIDPESQEITLNLRPTITRITGMKEDPAVRLMAKQMNVKDENTIKSEIPIVAVREIDSVLRMKSGEVVILGGLMQEGASSIAAGIPGTEDTPFSFFTQGKRLEESIVELVIFLRATILKAPELHPSDQRLYQKYTKDPRKIGDTLQPEKERI